MAKFDPLPPLNRSSPNFA